MVNRKFVHLFKMNNFVSWHFLRIQYFGGKTEFFIFIETFLMNKRKDITYMKK